MCHTLLALRLGVSADCLTSPDRAVQVQLRCEASETARAFAALVVTDKSACAMLSCALACIATEAQSAQWICGELEASQWEATASPTDLQAFARCERIAAERIKLFGAFSSKHTFDTAPDTDLLNILQSPRAHARFISFLRCVHVAARLVADANTVWDALRRSDTQSATAEGKLLDALFAAATDTIKAASALVRELLAPRGHAQQQPGPHVLDTVAAVSHELVEGLYDVLSTSAEQVDPNKGSGDGGASPPRLCCCPHVGDRSKLNCAIAVCRC